MWSLSCAEAPLFFSSSMNILLLSAMRVPAVFSH